MTATEEWRPVIGYEGHYEVSSHGRVRGALRGKINGRHGGIKPKMKTISKARYGYQRVKLCLYGEAKDRLVHTLVAEAFLGKRQDGMQVNHRNGIKSDNHHSNLEWVTASENIRHAYRNGLMQSRSMTPTQKRALSISNTKVTTEIASIINECAVVGMTLNMIASEIINRTGKKLSTSTIKNHSKISASSLREIRRSSVARHLFPTLSSMSNLSAADAKVVSCRISGMSRSEIMRNHPEITSVGSRLERLGLSCPDKNTDRYRDSLLPWCNQRQLELASQEMAPEPEEE